MLDNLGSLQMPQICGQAASTADPPNGIRTEEHKLLFTAPQETQRTPRDLMSCAALRWVARAAFTAIWKCVRYQACLSAARHWADKQQVFKSRGVGPNGTAHVCLPSAKRAKMNKSKRKSHPLIDYCSDKSRIDRQHSFMHSDLRV